MPGHLLCCWAASLGCTHQNLHVNWGYDNHRIALSVLRFTDRPIAPCLMLKLLQHDYKGSLSSTDVDKVPPAQCYTVLAAMPDSNAGQLLSLLYALPAAESLHSVLNFDVGVSSATSLVCVK